MCVGPATRRAGVTHTFPFLCSAAHCAAMLLSCFSLWSTLRVRGVCSRERFASRSSWRLLSPPRLLCIAEKVVASSSACRLKRMQAHAAAHAGSSVAAVRSVRPAQCGKESSSHARAAAPASFPSMHRGDSGSK